MLCLFTSSDVSPILCVSLSTYIPCGLSDWTGKGESCTVRFCQAKNHSQAKEFMPAHVLRRILALQNELITSAPAVATPTNTTQQATGPKTQRTLLSANFGIPNPLQNGTKAANTLGRNLLSAGDRLRDMIVPDALAAVVSAPVSWMPGMGGKKGVHDYDGGKRVEKLREELDDVLGSSCPLCESVVAGLDKPFVQVDEEDSSWAL